LELSQALHACSSTSAPGPDHVTWGMLKHLSANPRIAALFLGVAEACIQVGHWPAHFKESLSVIIPKPGKPSYATPKSFCPIVLLNTLGKLVEKMLSRRMQYDGVQHGAFQPNQFGGISQRSTEDAGVFLTHLIRAGWAKKLKTSVVAFDIAQFFPSLNHDVLMVVIQKAGFPPVLGNFFRSYLTGRKTMYKWDDSVSGLFAADIGVGQGSGLSPVLSGLYIGPVMKLFSFEPISKEVQLLSYVDDGTILTQSTHLVQNLPKLKAAYGVIFRLLMALGLVLEHDKSEVFHFSRSRGESHPPIDLGFAPYTGDTPLGPKLYWRYLGFYFDHSLTFREHIRYYSNKAMTTVKALGMLGNSNRGVSASHKCLLYRTCVVPVATYGLRLWYLQGARLKGIIKGLSAVQRLAALWIMGCFRTSPTGGTEALAGLVPMHILLKRLVSRSCARMATLGHSHPVRALLEPAQVGSAPPVPLGLAGLSTALKRRLISPAKDAQAACAEFTETFQALHPEMEPGNRLLDIFLGRIVCHLSPRMSDDRYGDYVKQLDATLMAAR